MAAQTVVLPGQSLAEFPERTPGNGTHVHDSTIYASISGLVPSATPNTVHVQRASTVNISATLPTVNTEVLARVTRTNTRQANVTMLVVGDHVCDAESEFQGLIRQQDIRATEKDKVKVGESFRPGDVVRAVVVSLGDQGGYYLSTAGNRYGVVMAWGEGGGLCSPISWKEVVDPVTGAKEPRKVAKPD